MRVRPLPLATARGPGACVREGFAAAHTARRCIHAWGSTHQSCRSAGPRPAAFVVSPLSAHHHQSSCWNSALTLHPGRPASPPACRPTCGGPPRTPCWRRCRWRPRAATAAAAATRLRAAGPLTCRAWLPAPKDPRPQPRPQKRRRRPQQPPPWAAARRPCTAPS